MLVLLLCFSFLFETDNILCKKNEFQNFQAVYTKGSFDNIESQVKQISIYDKNSDSLVYQLLVIKENETIKAIDTELYNFGNCKDFCPILFLSAKDTSYNYFTTCNSFIRGSDQNEGRAPRFVTSVNVYQKKRKGFYFVQYYGFIKSASEGDSRIERVFVFDRKGNIRYIKSDFVSQRDNVIHFQW